MSLPPNPPTNQPSRVTRTAHGTAQLAAVAVAHAHGRVLSLSDDPATMLPALLRAYQDGWLTQPALAVWLSELGTRWQPHRKRRRDITVDDVLRARRELATELHRTPDATEVAAHLGKHRITVYRAITDAGLAGYSELPPLGDA